MDIEGSLEKGQELSAGLCHFGVEEGRVVAAPHAVQLSIEHNDGLALL